VCRKVTKRRSRNADHNSRRVTKRAGASHRAASRRVASRRVASRRRAPRNGIIGI